MSQKRIKEEDSPRSETPSPKRSKLEEGPVKTESIKSEAADHGDVPVDTGRQSVKFKQCTAEVYRAAGGRLFADPPFPIARATFDLLKGVKSNSKQVIKKGDLDLVYFKPYLTIATATALYNWCLQELPWFKVQYKARGMDINTPR